jgi:hypothetical protein
VGKLFTVALRVVAFAVALRPTLLLYAIVSIFVVLVVDDDDDSFKTFTMHDDDDTDRRFIVVYSCHFAVRHITSFRHGPLPIYHHHPHPPPGPRSFFNPPLCCEAN